MARSIALFLVAALTACEAAPSGFVDPDARARMDGSSGSMDGSMVETDATSPMPDSVPIMMRETGPVMLTPDAACFNNTSPTNRAPMNLLLVLDRSGSMSERPSSGSASKWESAVAGLRRLLMALDDEARVGLMVFPALSNADTAAGYATPLEPIAPLRTSRMTLLSRLSSLSPSGGTPMGCAVPQAINFYNRMFTMDGSRNVVLITDGAPTDECSGTMCNPFDIANFPACILSAGEMAQVRIVASVAVGMRGDPSVRTYVIGTPEASDPFLSNLAINGNTRRAPGCEPNSCHYSLRNMNFDMDLNAALDSIRGRASTCEFRLNIDPMRVDLNFVNVNFNPGGGQASMIIPRDRTNGWEFSSDMRSVILNGTSCEQVLRSSSDASVQILLGCPTITPG